MEPATPTLLTLSDQPSPSLITITVLIYDRTTHKKSLCPQGTEAFLHPEMIGYLANSYTLLNQPRIDEYPRGRTSNRMNTNKPASFRKRAYWLP